MATINNTASVTYNYGTSGTDSAVSNVAVTNLLEEYAISGYKISNNQRFRPGENITYQIHVSNDGTNPLYNVTISDNLGGDGSNLLVYITGSATLNLNGTVNTISPTSTNPLIFTLPTSLSAGDMATITYIARVPASVSNSVSTITNTASITANEGSASGTQISVSPSPSLTITREDFADISLSKNASSSQIVSGETFSYTIVLTNSGNLDATGVVITDVLPTNFIVTSITSVSGGALTTYETSDYTIESSSNTLTLPTGSDKTITVPAATSSGNGTATITITGSIS